MAAEYDFQRLPGAKNDGTPQPLYPKIVSKGTIDTKRMVSDISQMSSFSPADINGLLTAFEERISYYLSEGHHVQLGNMGYFSAGLKARPVTDRKEIHAQSIYFGKVNFRVSPHFRKECAGFVVRSKRSFHESSNLSESERYRRLSVYLESHPFITRADYSSLTGLLKKKALNDLNSLVEKGNLSTLGRGTHKVYIKPVKQEVTE